MKIGLQNFQGITTYQEIQLKPITLIYGRNSSGKSTIFDAITVAKSIHKDHAAALPLKWMSQIDERVPAIKNGLDTIVKVSDLVGDINRFDGWVSEAGILSEMEGDTVLARLMRIFESMHRMYSCEFRWSQVGGEVELQSYKVEFDGMQILQWEKRREVNLVKALHRCFHDSRYDRENFTNGILSPGFSREVKKPMGLLRINIAHDLVRLLLDDFFGLDTGYPWQVVDDQVHLECNIDGFSGSLDHVISGEHDFDFVANNPLCVLVGFLICGVTSTLHDYLDVMDVPPVRSLSQGTELDGKVKFLNYLAECHEKSILSDTEEDRMIFGDYLDSINKWLTDREYLGCDFEISPRTSFSLTLSELERYSGLPEAARVDFLREAAPVRTEIKLRDVLRKAEVELEDVGTGISQVIPVLIGARCRKAYIQQPELHLHPAMQSPLADIFIESINSEPELAMLFAPWGVNYTFLAIETHSELLALRILRRIRETKAGKLPRPNLSLSPDSVSVIYVARKSTGEMTITNLRISDQGDFLDRWPDGFFAERDAELFYD